MTEANEVKAVLHLAVTGTQREDGVQDGLEVTRYRMGCLQAPHPLVAWARRSR